jgi:hypothetical protein
VQHPRRQPSSDVVFVSYSETVMSNLRLLSQLLCSVSHYTPGNFFHDKFILPLALSQKDRYKNMKKIDNKALEHVAKFKYFRKTVA